VKLVFWDGTAVCLFAERLEEGEFRWPKIENGVMRLSAAQLSALEGLDWGRVRRRLRARDRRFGCWDIGPREQDVLSIELERANAPLDDIGIDLDSASLVFWLISASFARNHGSRSSTIGRLFS
jgi:hypothetical protein